MDVIILPNNEKLLIDFNDGDRKIENVVAKFCGEDFATALMDYISDLEDRADYEKMKLDTDVVAYEVENEEFRTTLCDINTLLQEFEDKLDDGREKFSRKRVFKLFEEIHRLINEVI